MVNRIFLYILKNFYKLLGTFVVIIITSLVLNTLVYLTMSLNSVVSETSYSLVNVTDESFFQGTSGDADGLTYQELYDKSSEGDSFSSYRVDITADANYAMIGNDFPVNLSPIVGDNQIDFVNGVAEITQGELYGDGVVVSEMFAEKYDLSIGSTIDLTSFLFAEFEDLSANLTEVPEITYPEDVAKHSVDVIGIYTSSDYKSLSLSFYYPEEEEQQISMHTMYIDATNLQTLYEALRTEVLEGDLGDSEFGLGGLFSSEQVTFIRYLSEFNDAQAGIDFAAYVENNTLYDVVDSAKTIEDASEPVETFSLVITLLTFVAVLVSGLGFYLNYYIHIEKRMSEFTSLLSFGISKFKIGLQTAIELILVSVFAIPIGFLIFESTIGAIIEFVKRYYIVIIEDQIVSSDSMDTLTMFYNDVSYLSINPSEIVNFVEPNSILCLAIVTAVIIVMLFMVTMFETIRRIDNKKRA